MNKEYFFNRLGINHSTPFEQYDYEQLPWEFKATDKIPIVCLTHGLFHQRAINHINGQGCPKCGVLKCTGENVLATDDYIRRAVEKHGEKFSYRKTRYTGKARKLIVTCPVHGDQEIYAYQHLACKLGCLECTKERTRQAQILKLITRAKQVHGDRYDYSRVRYVNTRTPVTVVCKVHGAFETDLYAHAVKGTRCPACAIESGKMTSLQFIEKARGVHGDRYGYKKVTLNGVADHVTITCPVHGDFTQRAQSHLSGNGCKQCFLSSNKKSKVQFIADAVAAHGDFYDYSKVQYLGNKRKVEVICPAHGPFWITPNSHLSAKNGCFRCYESKGEKAIARYLERNEIEYIREYRIKPMRYRFDFFLPGLKVLIEFHGPQHYRPLEFFGGASAFARTKERDTAKTALAKLAGYRLIVLPYDVLQTNSIDDVLDKKLKKYTCSNTVSKSQKCDSVKPT